MPMSTTLPWKVNSYTKEKQPLIKIGSFDDCQDMVKSMFADPDTNKKHRLAAINSINWARILAQITYYVYSYFSLVKSPSYASGNAIRWVVPSGNFGDMIVGLSLVIFHH